MSFPYGHRGESRLSEFKLVEHFKSNPILTTDLGQFTYRSLIGQGGNAHVLQFYKEPTAFAIKFLQHQDARKLSRLKDEFFSAAQLSSHVNVAQNYHFDQVKLGGHDLSLIVMRLYGDSLKKTGPLPASLTQDERTARSVKLFFDLLNGLAHLHEGGVIHRDLKPENIFFDQLANAFVIGDLGIAHFSDEFPREADTRASERLGNYLFSPKEQADSTNEPVPAWDLFALGQVVQWFMTGSTHRGVGRKRFSDDNSPLDLRVLDRMVELCLQDSPAARPDSVAAVREAIDRAKNPVRDITLRGDDLDTAICMSFEKIDKVWYSTVEEDIDDFLSNFLRECRPEEFCTVYPGGGDQTGTRFEHLEGRRWLLNDVDELLIENLFAYRDRSRNYRSFFIVLAGADEPFQWVDASGTPVQRTVTDKEFPDGATLFEGRYLDAVVHSRRFFKCNGQTIPVTRDQFSFRQRHLRRTAYLVVPDRSAASCMTDRRPMEDLLNSVAASRRLGEEALSAYLSATLAHHSRELTRWD